MTLQSGDLRQFAGDMALQVPDVDTFAEHAVAAGAKISAQSRTSSTDVAMQTARSLRIHLERVHRQRGNVPRGNAPPLPSDDGEGKKKPAVDPVPKGYTTLTTYLVAQDADALIDFMKKTFDARGTLPQRARL